MRDPLSEYTKEPTPEGVETIYLFFKPLIDIIVARHITLKAPSENEEWALLRYTRYKEYLKYAFQILFEELPSDYDTLS